jgi:hypothetical protein
VQAANTLKETAQATTPQASVFLMRSKVRLNDRVRQARLRPNKRLQLTAAVGGVRRGWPSGGRSPGRRASALRSVLGWFTRGRS